MSKNTESTKKAKLLNNLPDVLNVRGAISPSTAVFYSLHEEGELRPIRLVEIHGVGTFAAFNHQYAEKNQKKDRMSSSNPYSGDAAYMPTNSDTLVAKMSLVIDQATSNFDACDSEEFRSNMDALAKAFFSSPAGTKLASMYTDNLLKCQWLFRNRKAPERSVKVDATTCLGETVHRASFIFDSVGNTPSFAGEGYDALVDLVRKALAGETNSKLILDVVATLKVGYGAQLFPSQKWEDQDKGSKKGKFLFIASINEDATGMSPQKIGNGLRTIDVWHGKGDRAIPVNPYGQDRETQDALRLRKDGNDFYVLLNQLHENVEQTRMGIKAALTAEDVSGDAYFVIANMIRGGVFGAKQSDKE